MDLIAKHKLFSIIIALSILAVIVGTTFVLINNKKDIESPKDICVVQFETNGGSKVEEQRIKCGSMVKQPDNPEKEGFVFKYWNYNEQEYDFNSPVMEDIIIKAYYEIEVGTEVVTISFDTNGGSKIDNIQIKKGEVLQKPVNPYKLGYNFVGWYKDNVEFDFSMPINDNIVLKAKWDEIHYSKENMITNEFSSKYKCMASYRSDIPEKSVSVGYMNPVFATWSTDEDYFNYTVDACYKTYKSSDSNIATVSERGSIEAKKSGTVYITECLNDTETKKEIACFKGKLIISGDNSSSVDNFSEENFKNNYACIYKFSDFSPKRTNIDLNLNEIFETASNVKYGYAEVKTTCIAKVFPKNENIIRVISDTKVKALSVGKTSVEYCIVEKYSNKKMECFTYNINVVNGEEENNDEENSKIENISLNKSSINLERGNSETLIATVTPSNIEESVIWSTSNSSVAEVNSTGKITAVGKGNAIITASSKDGKVVSQCTVTVVNPKLSAEASIGISINFTDTSVTKGVEATIEARGGSGTYNYYFIKLYKDGFLISQTSDTSSNSLFCSGYTNGNYYAEIEVRDSDGNVYKETSKITTISGF